MNRCKDCGCKVIGGACINCHEAIFIEEQYFDLGMPCPKDISQKANEHRKKINRKNKRKKE